MDHNELRLECLRLAQADAHISNDDRERTGESIVKRARQYAEFIDWTLALPRPGSANKDQETR